MSESKAAFRRRLGRLLNILTPATTSDDGSTSSFIAQSLVNVFTNDDTMNGAAVYDVDGEEWRVVEDWIVSSATGTVTWAYSNSMTEGRDIEVYEQFTPQNLDDALRMALDEAYQYITVSLVDESIEVEAQTYEYVLPESIRDFSRIAGAKVTWSTNPNVETWPRNLLYDWEVRNDGETQTLVLPNIAGLIGKTLRLEAKGVPAYPTADGSLLPFRSDTLQLLAFKAAEIAWRTGPGLSGRDAEFAANQEMKWAAKFDEKRDEWGTPLVPATFESNIDYPSHDYPLAYFHRDPS